MRNLEWYIVFYYYSEYISSATGEIYRFYANLTKAIYKKQNAMLDLIDKKLDLDVWQEINRDKI